MNARWLTGRTLRVLAAPLVLAGAVTAMAPGGASASTCVSRTGVQPPSPGSSFNVLRGVAVVSACNVWAVGYYNSGTGYQTLIVHWNGSAWRQVSSPNPGGSSRRNILLDVHAVSSSNVWAVGYYDNGTAYQTLIEHWNGSAWMKVPSPNVTGFNELFGVAGTSSHNIWAVGQYHYNGTAYHTLIEHWDGTAWTHVSSPNQSGTDFNGLFGVSATSSSNAWAVGNYYNGTAYQALIEHWNGSAWKRVSSPNLGGSATYSYLQDVSATSSSNAWAVGNYYHGTAYQTLIEHWNGSAWKRVSSPSSPISNVLNGVSATSSSNAWAVGYYNNGTAFQTLIEHWNGSAWKRVSSPNQGGSANYNVLNGGDAVSSNKVWAVGYYSNATATETLALHCC